MKKKIKKYKELISYLIIGILTTIVSLTTYYFLTYTILNPKKIIEIQIANIISWIVSVTFAYFTNRKFVFLKKEKVNFKEFISFYISRLSTLLIDMFMMYLLVTVLKFDDRIVKIIIQFVIFVLNYILSKFIVFKNKNIGVFMKKNSNKIRIRKIILYILLFLLFLINSGILHNFSGDNYLNYGFSYNMVAGLIPYKDFNMVLFPFVTLLIAFIMKIFGTKLIVYYIFNSLVFTMIIYCLEKLNKFSIPYCLLFLLIFPTGGYNPFCLLLFLILLWLEKHQKSDYLIGLILGLLIVTNQKMILLTIPTLLSRDWHKLIKRLGIGIIPLLLLLIYLLVTKSFSSFLDYTILGLFEFGSNNFNKIPVFLILEVVIIINLVYKYFKFNDILIIYILLFQIIAIPILDPYHITIALIPLACYFFHGTTKTLKIINYFLVAIILIFLVSSSLKILNEKQYYFNLDKKSNFYLTISDKNIDYINNKLTDYYLRNISKYDNIYFIYNDMYYHKLKSKIPINKFDLILLGNNGYNGNQKLKKVIKDMDNTLFIIGDYKITGAYDQTNYEIMDFIRNNYPKLECLSEEFCAYEIKKVN